MRTNVVLDDQLVQEAFAVTNIRTKRELIHEGLRALIRARTKRRMVDLAGQIRFRDDYDHKALRGTRGDAD